ncbi:transporter [Variovorax sp. J22R133]|uniref:transporter n=1 Tax=Variovorax brevis TaxID=3053503 RepID=UPI0025755C72|nr:transporter [Variovorax sp. J22R133]MDM0113094.1 transporter [Variovorax sp. J22R133]
MPPANFPDAIAANYGGDEAGLICGFLFGADGVGKPLTSAAAADWLAASSDEQPAAPEPQAQPAFAWLHFNFAHVAAERWLSRHAQLSDDFFEALHDGLYSTRIERAEQSLVAVINDVHFDFELDASDISTLWISVDRRLVVTARRHPLRSCDNLRTAILRGEAIRSTADLLERLMRTQADVLVGIVRSATDRVDKIEDQLLAGRLNTKRARLGGLRRVLVRLQRLLAPEPAALFRLLQNPPAWMAGNDVEELRAATEEFSVVLRDMQALQERIKLLQEEIAASVNEDNNRSLFVLTVVTVLALPINILAGLFGMNVGGIPLAQDEHGFWVVVAIVVSFTAIAGWLALRRQKDR